MKFLVDTADLEGIKRAYEIYACDGVTTNPSILAKTGQAPYKILLAIRELIGADAALHVQVTADRSEVMIEEAKAIASRLGKNTYIKVPVTTEGLKAIKALSADGFKITATAVYTTAQAYLAAKAGADFVAPYVNRIDNLGGDGIETVRKIQNILENNGFGTQVLAASFKNSCQVMELCEYGIRSVTVASDVIENFIKNACVTSAVDDFQADFESLCGKGKTDLSDKGSAPLRRRKKHGFFWSLRFLYWKPAQRWYILLDR